MLCVHIIGLVKEHKFIKTARNKQFQNTWGSQKFPELLQFFFKFSYNFETLVPFEVLPLRLDAAIPASLPVLETLSKIFNGNAVKGRQRFADGP